MDSAGDGGEDFVGDGAQDLGQFADGGVLTEDGDGVSHLGRGAASFSLNGHRVPTIGNICMDMCMLDVTGVPCAVGDTVTVFGEDPTVSELAQILGTIPYEILASVPRRIHRLVVRR